MARQPNKVSKILSIITVLVFVITFGLSAYLPSALKGDVNANIFTISQSLAFSIKPLFVVLLSIAVILLSFLIYYRGQHYQLIRLFLLLVIFAFIVTILWVTTMYNLIDHYICAIIIFVATFIFITINSLSIYDGFLGKNCISFAILTIIPILAFFGIVGLIVSNIYAVNKTVPELFPAFENYMIVIKGLSILTLGFI